MNGVMPLTVFGFISSLLTIGMIYYTLKIVMAFRENTELAATKMVLHEEILGSFQALSVSSMVFAFLSYIGSMALVLDFHMVTYLSEIGGLAMMLGFIYFQKIIAEAVSAVKKED